MKWSRFGCFIKNECFNLSGEVGVFDLSCQENFFVTVWFISRSSIGVWFSAAGFKGNFTGPCNWITVFGWIEQKSDDFKVPFSLRSLSGWPELEPSWREVVYTCCRSNGRNEPVQTSKTCTHHNYASTMVRYWRKRSQDGVSRWYTTLHQTVNHGLNKGRLWCSARESAVL